MDHGEHHDFPASHVAMSTMQRPGAPWGAPGPEELLHRLGFQVPPDLIDGDRLELTAAAVIAPCFVKHSRL